MNKKFISCFLILVLVFIVGYQATECETKIENPNLGNVSYEVAMAEQAENLDCEVQIQDLDLYTEEYDKPFYPITEDDRYVIECIVAGEAKGESMEGKMAVAQTILNAMVKDGLSASDVRKQYQYSGWDEELQNLNSECWDEVCDAVSRVFDNGESVTENPILFFYAPKWVDSKWHRTLPYDQTIGGHSFHYLEEDVNADWFLELQNERQQF